MRTFLLALALCFWASPAFATVGYPIMASSDDVAIATVATEYHGIMGHSANGNWDTTEGNVYQIIPAAGTMSRLYVELDTAPDNGAGTQSYTITFRAGATSGTIADTAVTVTISETATTGSYQGAGIAISAGDRVSYSVAAANTPATTRMRMVMFWEPTTAGQYFWTCGNETGIDTVANNYFHAVGDCIRDSAESDKYGIVGKAAVVKNLYVEHGTAPDNGVGTQSYVWTIRDCGAYTAPSCAASVVTCTVSETTPTCADTTNSFTINAEDIMTLESDPSTAAPVAPGTIHVGFVLEMSDPQTWVMAVTNQTALSTTNTQYLVFHSEEEAGDATEANVGADFLEATLTGIWVRLGDDPGTSPDAYSFTARQDALDVSPACSVTIIADNTTNEKTDCDVRYQLGAEGNLEITPLDTPATAVTRSQIGTAWAYRKRRKVLIE